VHADSTAFKGVRRGGCARMGTCGMPGCPRRCCYWPELSLFFGNCVPRSDGPASGGRRDIGHAHQWGYRESQSKPVGRGALVRRPDGARAGRPVLGRGGLCAAAASGGPLPHSAGCATKNSLGPPDPGRLYAAPGAINPEGWLDRASPGGLGTSGRRSLRRALARSAHRAGRPVPERPAPRIGGCGLRTATMRGESLEDCLSGQGPA
jgi:hypothetical protein